MTTRKKHTSHARRGRERSGQHVNPSGVRQRIVQRLFAGISVLASKLGSILHLYTALGTKSLSLRSSMSSSIHFTCAGKGSCVPGWVVWTSRTSESCRLQTQEERSWRVQQLCHSPLLPD